MSFRWVGVAFVLFAGGWGVGLLALPLSGEVGTGLLAVWCTGAFAASYLTCRSALSERIREATAGALLMAAAMSLINAVFPDTDLFAPPAVLGSWAAVAAVVFAVSLAGAYLGSRRSAPPGKLALALLGALFLVGVVMVLGLAYAVAAFIIPSFAIGFVFVFALLGAPAFAGVIAVAALGDRSRTAIIGGAVALGLLLIGLVITSELAHPTAELGALVVGTIGVGMSALLIGLIGLAGIELGYRLDLGPKSDTELPRASVN